MEVADNVLNFDTFEDIGLDQDPANLFEGLMGTEPAIDWFPETYERVELVTRFPVNLTKDWELPVNGPVLRTMWDAELDPDPASLNLNIPEMRCMCKKVLEEYPEEPSVRKAMNTWFGEIGYNIVKVERVQNIKLARKMRAEQAEEEQANHSRMFHGTSAEGVASITSNGFASGIVRGLHGRGIYTARSLADALCYSTPTDDVQQVMVCRVLYDQLESGKQDKIGSPKVTLVDPSNTLWCSFGSNQVLPEYVFTFKALYRSFTIEQCDQLIRTLTLKKTRLHPTIWAAFKQHHHALDAEKRRQDLNAQKDAQKKSNELGQKWLHEPDMTVMWQNPKFQNRQAWTRVPKRYVTWHGTVYQQGDTITIEHIRPCQKWALALKGREGTIVAIWRKGITNRGRPFFELKLKDQDARDVVKKELTRMRQGPYDQATRKAVQITEFPWIQSELNVVFDGPISSRATDATAAAAGPPAAMAAAPVAMPAAPLMPVTAVSVAVADWRPVIATGGQ